MLKLSVPIMGICLKKMRKRFWTKLHVWLTVRNATMLSRVQDYLLHGTLSRLYPFTLHSRASLSGAPITSGEFLSRWPLFSTSENADDSTRGRSLSCAREGRSHPNGPVERDGPAHSSGALR